MPTSREEKSGAMGSGEMKTDAVAGAVTDAAAANPSGGSRRAGKVVLGLAVALVFLAAFNALLTFVLEPYGSRSQLAWSDYARQDEIDTILVGTSFVEYNIDPAVLNSECGYRAYNLGSPSQTIEESFVGIRTAYEDHGIKRAILGISTNVLTSSTPPNPGSAYMRNRSFHVSPIDTFTTTNEFMWHYGSATSAYSINFLFPWASNPIRSLKVGDLATNVKAKIEGADVAKMAEKLEYGWHYVGLGHGTRKNSMDLNGTNVKSINEGIDEDEEAGAALAEDTTILNPDRERTLHEICAYCVENDIALTVIVPPLPVYDVFDEHSTYFETVANVERFLAEEGVQLYDFNLASSDLFDSKPEYFNDNYHLNLAGAQVFSRSLATFMNALEAGEDVSDMFVTPEEQLEDIDYLSALFATSTVDDEGVHLDWRIVTSPENQVEYRVLMRQTDNVDDYRPVCEWSTSTSFTYVPEQRGMVKLRICARKVGSDAEYERYRTMTEVW